MRAIPAVRAQRAPRRETEPSGTDRDCLQDTVRVRVWYTCLRISMFGQILIYACFFKIFIVILIMCCLFFKPLQYEYILFISN